MLLEQLPSKGRLLWGDVTKYDGASAAGAILTLKETTEY